MFSPHFTEEEVSFSSTAMRLGIDNKAPADVMKNALVAASGMELVRARLGSLPIHVDSWYRCEALEKVVASGDYHGWCIRHSKAISDQLWGEYFKRKAHPTGFAVDFTCAAFGTPLEIVKSIMTSGMPFDECIMEGTWVHISFANAMRRIVMTATFVNGIPWYKTIS